ncbi:MAG: monooxygenase [SAR202 cluster bacterium]|nr:monooxygenase [SAR202 cluster bacterium]|tara:strand:- start:66628 stop:67752 length:1125 start_codon:yes stop_codon:yes gene_type:complete
MKNYDVVIVGAGASGIGIASMLKDFGVKKMVVLERYKVGATFEKWPKEMRFITPSFTTNFWGHMDLNSVVSGTSPAYSLDTEHPTGKEYAKYLRLISRHLELPINENADVENVEYSENRFIVHIKGHKIIKSRFLIWAAGEFQYPNSNLFSSSPLLLHTSQIESWEQIQGDQIYIIGGGESGIDAAINLSRLGKKVVLLEGNKDWNSIRTTDPSVNLSPYTIDRLNEEMLNERITFFDKSQVKDIKLEDDKYRIYVRGKKSYQYQSATPPIIATGFKSSLMMVKDFFDWDKTNSYVLLNEHDESIKTPGLFLVGPQVRHENHILCFIYKFRQRFGVVCNAIGNELEMDISCLKQYRKEGLYLDDLGDCGQECPC